MKCRLDRGYFPDNQISVPQADYPIGKPKRYKLVTILTNEMCVHIYTCTDAQKERVNARILFFSSVHVYAE